jgi:hypothetical protein
MKKKVNFIVHDGSNDQLHMIQWLLPLKKGEQGANSTVSETLVAEELEKMVEKYDFLQHYLQGHHRVTHVLYISGTDIKSATLT